jgi:hypothetical protein
MSRWFRYYDEAINDPKILKLSDEQFRFWVGILCVASKCDGTLPSHEDIAIHLRMKVEKVRRHFSALIDVELIDRDGDDFHPHNWDARQYKSDTSNERVKRHRKRKCNVTSTVTVTPPETEADTEAEKDDAVDGERATPGASITPEAFALSERLILAAGWDRDEPHAMGTPWTAQKWLNGNWNPDLCVATVQRVKAAARKKINTLAYFEAAIAEAHAQQAAPLPTVIIDQNPEVIHAPGQRPRNGWQASRDAGRDAFTELQAFNAQQDGGEDDGTIVELLPAARRG